MSRFHLHEPTSTSDVENYEIFPHDQYDFSVQWILGAGGEVGCMWSLVNFLVDFTKRYTLPEGLPDLIRLSKDISLVQLFDLGLISRNEQKALRESLEAFSLASDAAGSIGNFRANDSNQHPHPVSQRER
jgi:hypothetical protein